MALIKCPECVREISDKAAACPHCGYPITTTIVKKKSRGRSAKNKRRKLPNGFGSITEIRGRNLRKPFYARKTTGKDASGKLILKPLKPEAYFESYDAAYAALVEYNRNPYDLAPDLIMSELYEKWTDAYFQTLKNESSARAISSSWAYCSSIYNMRAKDVRARHMKGCMEDGFIIGKVGKRKGEVIRPSAGLKGRIKSMFNLMFDYAVEYEVVDRNYARTFEISGDIIKEREEAKRSHIPFTEDEREVLWNNLENIRFVDIILIQMYSGWRPLELVTLELSNVNLDEWYFQAGMKTDAGKDRIVPIHSKIRDLVKKNYEFAQSIGSNYLFNDTKSMRSPELTYDKYSHRFKKVIDALNLNPDHRAHDPRITFVTMAKRANVDEYVIKLLVGHRIEDITEKVYTVRDLEWLREEIEKI
jgi:integrase/DNA-directed RNA polymerase subunit RPC12/RpoP